MLKQGLAKATITLAPLMLFTWAACGPQQPAAAPAPEVPPYQPNFTYKPAAASEKKLDVTIGVVNPQFTNTANSVSRQQYLGDTVAKGMLSAMGATFNEVLVAKGFNTKGPFTSLNDMNYPDKKGSDLLLYPDFDYEVTLVRSGDPHPAAGKADAGNGTMFGGMIKTDNGKQGAAGPPPVCDFNLVVVGNVSFVAQEPLSGERMWNKRLDLSSAAQPFKDLACDIGSKRSEDWPKDLKDAWAKAHETVYQNSMKSFDTYVNGEEFQGFKTQSQELRAKKSY